MSKLQLALMAGIDIPVPELGLTIHPPTIQDIAYMGEQDFFSALQYLCIDKEVLIQDEKVLQNYTNFQVLLKVLEQSEDKTKKSALITLLLLLFPSYRAVIMPKSIVITQLEGSAEPIMIDDRNFDVLQDMVKEVTCLTHLFQGKNMMYNPANAKAKAIADKAMRARRKIAAQKAAKQGDDSVLTRYLSILTIGAGIRLEDCKRFNLFQLFDLMERYNAYVNWDIDLRVRLAGGKPEHEAESWMKSLYSMK